MQIVGVRLDRVTAHLLQHSDEFANDKGEVQLGTRQGGYEYAIWVNTSKNPRLKAVELAALQVKDVLQLLLRCYCFVKSLVKEGAGIDAKPGCALQMVVEIPKQIALANLALRVHHRSKVGGVGGGGGVQGRVPLRAGGRCHGCAQPVCQRAVGARMWRAGCESHLPFPLTHARRTSSSPPAPTRSWPWAACCTWTCWRCRRPPRRSRRGCCGRWVRARIARVGRAAWVVGGGAAAPSKAVKAWVLRQVRGWVLRRALRVPQARDTTHWQHRHAHTRTRTHVHPPPHTHTHAHAGHPPVQQHQPHPLPHPPRGHRPRHMEARGGAACAGLCHAVLGPQDARAGGAAAGACGGGMRGRWERAIGAAAGVWRRGLSPHTHALSPHTSWYAHEATRAAPRPAPPLPPPRRSAGGTLRLARGALRA